MNPDPGDVKKTYHILRAQAALAAKAALLVKAAFVILAALSARFV